MEDMTSGTTPPEQQAGQQPSPTPPTPPPTPPSTPPPTTTAPAAQQPPKPAATPSNRRYWWIPASCAIGCLPWFLLVMFSIGAMFSGSTREPMSEHIALVRVTGVITAGGGSSDIWGSTSAGSEDIISQLERARKSKNVKAIVLRIDSPGGSAAGSEEVFSQIMRVRKGGKPVYTSMGDVAASGGYYIAAACDRIYADHNSLTGSIGVIFSMADMSELYRKIGYRPEVLKSGKFKDIGSAARALTPEERALIQSMIDNIYDKFLASVAEGRGMKVEDIKPVADGRIMTGSQALELKLVDKIGGLRDAIKDAAKAGGIKGEPKIVEYKKTGLLDMLVGGVTEGGSSRFQNELARRIADELLRADGGVEALR